MFLIKFQEYFEKNVFVFRGAYTFSEFQTTLKDKYSNK